ncbi:MAG: hypothetical protein WCU88_03765 [Elusimicrobiota bacterium]|jgi:hypothetical protein
MKKAKKTPKKNDPTGTYVYDPKLGKVVKVSSDIPSVASKAGDKTACGAKSPFDAPCGGGDCGGSCGLG